MKDPVIQAKHQRMLELLSEGSSSREIAKQMGYREGTMRVYLHNLYRALGVGNKTEAVVWYLNGGRARLRGKASGGAHGANGAGGEAAQELAVRRLDGADPVGEMAIDEDLYTALGAMSHFIGPYGRIWEVGLRLGGEEPSAKVLQRRARSRLLWRALLKGDCGYGKRLFDEDMGAALVVDSPSDAVLLAGLLLVGGFSKAADHVVGQLTHKRKAGAAASAREAAMLKALRDALEGDAQAMAALHRAAAEKAATHAVTKQVAMVLLYHAYRARRDLARARQTAAAIWGEAEAAVQHLEAMGERPLGGGSPVPTPGKVAVREGTARETALSR